MPAGGILNADMRQLGGWLRGGFRWWAEELRALVPAKLRGGGEPPRLLAPAAGEPWRLIHRGRAMPLEEAGGSRTVVTIVAQPAAVLTRPVTMPLLAAEDLERMLALDLDRLTPLGPDDALFDWETISRDPARERVEVLLGTMRREEAERLRDEAVAMGVRPNRLASASAGERLHFDFLRKLPDEAPVARHRRQWWSAVAALFAINLAILIGRDKIGTDRLEAAVDAAAPSASAARALQARLVRERRGQAQAIAARRRHEPLRVLSALSAALPAGAWVQRLSWDGRTVRIAGYKSPQLDVLDGLRRSPIFRDVRETGGDAASQTVAAQPYDLSASVVSPR